MHNIPWLNTSPILLFIPFPLPPKPSIFPSPPLTFVTVCACVCMSHCIYSGLSEWAQVNVYLLEWRQHSCEQTTKECDSLLLDPWGGAELYEPLCHSQWNVDFPSPMLVATTAVRSWVRQSCHIQEMVFHSILPSSSSAVFLPPFPRCSPRLPLITALPHELELLVSIYWILGWQVWATTPGLCGAGHQTLSYLLGKH